MNATVQFSEDQMDYLVESLNIGAGNAATALTHLLRSEVKMTPPDVEILQSLKAPSILGDPSLPVACVRMKMIGDMTGSLFFIIPDEDKAKLAELAERAMLAPDTVNPDPDRILGTLTEIGNILAGVYLTAIHDFCKLNLCHSVPVLAIDMIQALLDESLAQRGCDDGISILIKNEFAIGAERAKTYFLIMPSVGSLQALVGSMKIVGKMYGAQ